MDTCMVCLCEVYESKNFKCLSVKDISRTKQNKNYYLIFILITFISSNLFSLSFFCFLFFPFYVYLKRLFFFVLCMQAFLLFCFGIFSLFAIFIYRLFSLLKRKSSSHRTSRWRIWFLLFFVETTVTSSVLALRSSEICKQMQGLSPHQRAICEARPESMVHVSEGVELAMSECIWQFRHNKWNCSTEGGGSVLGGEVKFASRESAFITAIKSAGILHSIATACGRGMLRDCGCANKRGYFRTRRTVGRGQPDKIVARHSEETWSWGGCSVDLRFGLNFTSRFLNAGVTNERSLMRQHNEKAGRIIVSKRLRRACRCHGVSGSCAMKTCWITLPTFREVGSIIKKRYSWAKKVIALRGGHRGRPSFLKLSNPIKKLVKPPVSGLVYLEKSPSFCERNDRLGISGTRGRQCRLRGKGEQSCKNMCCGRGNRTVVYEKRETCNCKFYWCCTVRCQYCIKHAIKRVCI